MKKFIVKSGKVQNCIQDASGNWVTEKKGHLVALKNGTLLNGCREHVEEKDESTVEGKDS